MTPTEDRLIAAIEKHRDFVVSLGGVVHEADLDLWDVIDALADPEGTSVVEAERSAIKPELATARRGST